jgi:TolB-like protein/DNA-binding winged helix-turn-helix (wHTH) protein
MNRAFPLATHIQPITLGGESDFALSELHVCPSLREVRAGEKKETVEPRVMQVLVVLALAEGAVVSRETLIERCWGGRIVGEAAINTCIAKVRAVAGLGGGLAFEIETVPRVGYRLVRLTKPSQPRHEIPTTSAAPIVTTPFAMLRIRGLWIGGIAALVALLLAACWVGYRWQYAQQAPVEASIAVLPFVNMSGDPRKDYFSDGFTEELINDLSNNPHLRVTARTSAFAFKGRNADIASIARALHVGSIIEGSVRESGNHVRITAQLITFRRKIDVFEFARSSDETKDPTRFAGWGSGLRRVEV